METKFTTLSVSPTSIAQGHGCYSFLLLAAAAHGECRAKSQPRALSFLNVTNLLHKKDKAHLFLQQHSSAHVLGLSETWFKDSVPTGELAVGGFQIHRRDRSGRGGGLLDYVSEDITSIR